IGHPCGTLVEYRLPQLEFGRLFGLRCRLPQPLCQGRVVAGEARRARRNGHRRRDGAHFSGRRAPELVAAGGDVACAAADVGCPGLERPLPLLDGPALEAGGTLLELLDVGLQRLEPGARHAVAQRVDRIAHAAARIVEGPAPSTRWRAAAAATVLLAAHLAVGPADHAVELTAYGIEPRRDHGGRVARILLKAGKAGARCLLAGNQAPPEAVAETDRPDG